MYMALHAPLPVCLAGGRGLHTLAIGLAQHSTIQHARYRAGLRCCSLLLFLLPKSCLAVLLCSLCVVHNRFCRHTHTESSTPCLTTMGSAKATCTDPIPHPCEIVVLYQKHHYSHRGLPFALQALLTFITFICGASLSHMHAITTRPQLFSPLLFTISRCTQKKKERDVFHLQYVMSSPPSSPPSLLLPLLDALPGAAPPLLEVVL